MVCIASNGSLVDEHLFGLSLVGHQLVGQVVVIQQCWSQEAVRPELNRSLPGRPELTRGSGRPYDGRVETFWRRLIGRGRLHVLLGRTWPTDLSDRLHQW